MTVELIVKNNVRVSARNHNNQCRHRDKNGLEEQCLPRVNYKLIWVSSEIIYREFRNNEKALVDMVHLTRMTIKLSNRRQGKST